MGADDGVCDWYMRGHHEKNQTRFFACFAAAIFAAMAAAFSANLFTLFVMYEFVTISTYPLVTHHGDEKAKLGGRVYLGILLSTSVAFFMFAIAWTWQISGTLTFTQGGVLSEAFSEGRVSELELTILLGLFAFGIGKAALMPFHRWLPAAMVAPTPVSALFACGSGGQGGCVFGAEGCHLYFWAGSDQRHRGRGVAVLCGRSDDFVSFV